MNLELWVGKVQVGSRIFVCMCVLGGWADGTVQLTPFFCLCFFAPICCRSAVSHSGTVSGCPKST
jgi:hypothetical protein